MREGKQKMFKKIIVLTIMLFICVSVLPGALLNCINVLPKGIVQLELLKNSAER